MTLPAVHIPVIETERLILRGPSLDDLPASVRFGASDRSHFVGGPHQDWQVYEKIAAHIGYWAIRGYGVWTVTTRAGDIAGRIGIVHHLDWPEPELGWTVFDGFQGQGLAFEGAMAARDYAARHFGLGPLVSNIHPDNTRSRRLAERMGATVERETTLRNEPCLIYRHPQETAS
ncbi:GNAT family N-acetyltransferase [Paracoccus sp. (in: a-proteobacteria)]|uniref:GNAT family N-acetyltransferase n=1 Tax=Paracoccus sp. TaxID=267 RepID=UPI0026E048A7|nr:GNAT family N-acetyltransferase [Paracoccus sp. (in: a-proteobacteria)]MDO5646960.1 GNAT family N-acetyltransferase [Paracoccus sp. (in: a-proteobacteria)]